MGFTAEQRQALTAKLDGRVIRERSQAGQTLSYIEGWYAIAEANRVFGFEGWDRETVSLRCVWEGARQGRSACAYIAQVRIRVRAGDTLVCRDGHGSGTGSGSSPGEAHETAVKEAETDATKRALVTFGNAFGLCLYDKDQKQVRRRRKPSPIDWLLRSSAGGIAERFADPARFCSALRRALEGVATTVELERLQDLGIMGAALVDELWHSFQGGQCGTVRADDQNRHHGNDEPESSHPISSFMLDAATFHQRGRASGLQRRPHLDR